MHIDDKDMQKVKNYLLTTNRIVFLPDENSFITSKDIRF